MNFLKKAERTIRRLRDHYLIEPLARNRHVGRFALKGLEIAVIDCGDHCLAFDPNDGEIGNFVRENQGWFRQETMNIIKTMPKGGNVFIDVGANIGTQSIYALMHGGFQTAICFEPTPKTATILKLNALLNGLEDRITIIQKAAGSQTGSASLHLNKNNHGAHSLMKHQGSDSIIVPVTTVEKELADLGVRPEDIGLVWMDTEGFEGEVLKGWPSIKGRPLCIEYTPNYQKLPADTFNGWSQWGIASDPEITWQPISMLDLRDFSEQIDLLFC